MVGVRPAARSIEAGDGVREEMERDNGGSGRDVEQRSVDRYEEKGLSKGGEVAKGGRRRLLEKERKRGREK